MEIISRNIREFHVHLLAISLNRCTLVVIKYLDGSNKVQIKEGGKGDIEVGIRASADKTDGYWSQ